MSENIAPSIQSAREVVSYEFGYTMSKIDDQPVPSSSFVKNLTITKKNSLDWKLGK